MESKNVDCIKNYEHIYNAIFMDDINDLVNLKFFDMVWSVNFVKESFKKNNVFKNVILKLYLFLSF